MSSASLDVVSDLGQAFLDYVEGEGVKAAFPLGHYHFLHKDHAVHAPSLCAMESLVGRGFKSCPPPSANLSAWMTFRQGGRRKGRSQRGTGATGEGGGESNLFVSRTRIVHAFGGGNVEAFCSHVVIPWDRNLSA
eukprot:3432410-Pyramimonas_sp.AAC.3